MLDVVERLKLDDVAYLLPVAAERSWYPRRYFDPVRDNEPYLSWAIEACEAALGGCPAPRAFPISGSCSAASRRARAWWPSCWLEHHARSPARPCSRAPCSVGRPTAHRRRERPADVLCPKPLRRMDRPRGREATAQAFAEMGAAVVFEIYEDRQHQISDRAVAGLRALLSRGRLSGDRRTRARTERDAPDYNAPARPLLDDSLDRIDRLELSDLGPAFLPMRWDAHVRPELVGRFVDQEALPGGIGELAPAARRGCGSSRRRSSRGPCDRRRR